MNKKTAFTLGGIVLVVAVLSISTVMFFRYWNAPIAVEAVATEIETEDISQNAESSTPIAAPPIKAEPKTVIEDSTVSKPEDSVPPPEVIETTEPDGGVVQTPNWEAQKELAPDTDLNNPKKEPEYVKPPQSQASSKPTAPAGSSSKAEAPATSSKKSSTPKNGDKKSENGSTYTYLNGFGWVKDGNGGTTQYIDVELSGEKVGH